jgi:hypothetical protein
MFTMLGYALTLHRFPSLPAEIRDMIWDEAARTPAAFFVDFGVQPGIDPDLAMATSPVPKSHGDKCMIPGTAGAPRIKFAERKAHNRTPGPGLTVEGPGRRISRPQFRHPKLGLLLACKESRAAVIRVENKAAAGGQDRTMELGRPIWYFNEYPSFAPGLCPLSPFRVDLTSDLFLFDSVLFHQQKWSAGVWFTSSHTHGEKNIVDIPLARIGHMAIPWEAFFDRELVKSSERSRYSLFNLVNDIRAHTHRIRVDYHYQTRERPNLKTIYLVVDGLQPTDGGGEPRSRVP